MNLVGRCFEGNRTSAVMLTWPRWRLENKHSIWTEARDMRLETSHRFYQMWGQLSISSSHLPVSECCLQYDYVLVSGLIGCKKKRQITIFQLWNMDFLLICIHVCTVSLVLSSSRHKPTHIWNQKHLLKIIFLYKKKMAFPLLLVIFSFSSFYPEQDTGCIS